MNTSAQCFGASTIDIFVHFVEWQRLDDAAFLLEASLELALDKFCDGRGPAPTPEEVALAKRLRSQASTHLAVIQRTLRQARENSKLL